MAQQQNASKSTSDMPRVGGESRVSSSSKKSHRLIGRWFLGETLGKGGYSWVKKGYDRKTGRPVALKFMDRKKTKHSASNSKLNDGNKPHVTTENWNPKQMKQVKTEIEALKKLKHINVVRLLAYNLNTKYPSDDKDGSPREVVLLVLEYMAGGELFDILYYTSKLEPVIARTYFRQLIDAVEYCHASCIVHRDIKPQNLLLDKNFNLKISDFGLAKLIESDTDAVMDTFSVGTRGYQAPEVLLRQKYTASCDIFSAGVVLFILLAGYPPFEHASKSDRWYGPLSKKKYKDFWKNHKGCGISKYAQDLITRMLQYEPQDRITLPRIRDHMWFKGDFLKSRDLRNLLQLKHKDMEIKRKNDKVKGALLEGSGSQKIKRHVTAPPLPSSEPKETPADIRLTISLLSLCELLPQELTRISEERKLQFPEPLENYEFHLNDTHGKARLKLKVYDLEPEADTCYEYSAKKHLIRFSSKNDIFADTVRAITQAVATFDGAAEPPELPMTEAIGILDMYTTVHWLELLYRLKGFVENVCQGRGEFRMRDFSLDVTTAVESSDFGTPHDGIVQIAISVFSCAKYNCYIVKFRRTKGQAISFRKMLKSLQKSCSQLFTSVPDQHQEELKLSEEEQQLVLRYFSSSKTT